MLVLASRSPRRRELLALLEVPFQVTPVGIAEDPRPGEPPEEMVRRLAQAKARAAAQRHRDGLIIGADTIVVLDGAVLGKPRDEEEAVRMLKALRGREHWVHTGLALVEPATGRETGRVVSTKVPMRAYSDEEIARYVASGDPLDKAGAYAIQHSGFRPVVLERLQGCYANVVGLPLCSLVEMLEAWGVRPATDVGFACQGHLEITCPLVEERFPEARSETP
ncbi:MAG: septum formation inhibitor Maf [Chloroflexi bacterium]|nr:MAG: septum formation inhibitor Maf [Chloroflexota bacterium]